MDSRVKAFLFWGGIVCLCFVGIPFHLKGEDQQHLQSAFQNYSKQFNKTYKYDDEELEQKLTSFKKSLDTITMLNQQQEDSIKLSVSVLKSSVGDANSESKVENQINVTKWKPGMPKNQGLAAWGLTSFADMSPDEFKKQYLDLGMNQRIEMRQRNHHSHGKHKNKNHDHHSSHNDIENNLVRKKRATATALPDKVDWRNKNVINPVRHQQNCGACWAFSTVETVESMYALEKGKLQLLSIQQVINCATNGNMGCNGGDTCAAVSWMSGNKLVTEQEYPLTLKDATCSLRAPQTGVQVNSNFTCDNFMGNEDGLLSILANHGPVAAAVDATNWQYYVGGIIQWNCEANNNHAVQIVGYDKTATPPHYIVRNSWGTQFGDKGYLYIAIGSNLCGIAKEITSLTVM